MYEQAKRIVGAVVIMIGFTAVEAHATDDKSSPATTCRKYDGGGGTPWYGENSVWNASATTALTLTCPILRDVTSLAPGGRITFNAMDQTTAGQVCCRFRSRSADGVNLFQSAMVCTGVATASGQEIISHISTAGAPAHPDGRHNLWCTLDRQVSNTSQHAMVSYLTRE